MALPTWTLIGAIAFDDGAERAEVGHVTRGETVPDGPTYPAGVHVVIYPPDHRAEFDDETGDKLPESILCMSPAQARELAWLLLAAADRDAVA
jgi:hypothetical protein